MPLLILDYGSQTTQLIARRIRELQVYCELMPWDAPQAQIENLRPDGIILSGGPASVYTDGAPTLPHYVLELGLPVLGICYGMQLLCQALGGKVISATSREYGSADITVPANNPLLAEGVQPVWMSHGDRIDRLPRGWQALAHSPSTPYAAAGDPDCRLFGVQFHPEVRHTPGGRDLLKRFTLDICGCRQDWTPASIIATTVDAIRSKVGDEPVLAAVSGGVDSTVAAALVYRAVGSQLRGVFVDHGLLRGGERGQIETAYQTHLGAQVRIVDASDRFFNGLRGITEPEAKRRVIGETFIRVFEEQARRLGQPRFLVQGTIYPDVVESSAPERSKGESIKTHHNVGGLPKDLSFSLVEPLRYLFKDEVRAVGEALGLPASLVWRQPFPGPGLAVRCLGEVTPERVERLRAADAIFTAELEAAACLNLHAGEGAAQAFAVLLPVKSVGVMGDQRTYQETIVLRAVATDDFMTADWVRLPPDLLARAANRIVNEVAGVNRVVYDITSKPPATIEWE